ncbi:thioesterase [Ktedonobacteria bacterium brp13]|nr:thioesterase [Ktedonobacteria bacterium brp13]
MASNPHVSVWIPYGQRKPKAGIRLFCFPYAGGGASIFRNWSEQLPAEIEVCPVQLPGRESRLSEQPFSELPPLLDALMVALSPYMDMPYALFGHSMGALICFELTRALRRSTGAALPVHLLVSGRRAPHIADTDPPTHHLAEPEFIEELRRLQGTPEEVLQNAELLHILLPLLRADFALCETYTYTQEKALPCPITAFCGLYDREVPREAVAAWQKHTYNTFKTRFFVGDHFFLHKEQAALLQALAQALFAAMP